LSSTGISCPINQVDFLFIFLQLRHFISVEPVGTKAPTFSSDSSSFTFKKRNGESFGLLCQAQAFPVPFIR